MFAYIIRRLLLIIPTLFGIMLLNFVIVQAAPGGPVELMIARIKGTAIAPTARVGGSAGGETAGCAVPARASRSAASIAAPAASTPRSSASSKSSTASTSRPGNASST